MVPADLAFIAYNLVGALIMNGKIAVSADFTLPCLVGSVIFVGVAEEFVFSGTFIKSKNILVPIGLHMLWNLLVVVLIG